MGPAPAQLRGAGRRWSRTDASVCDIGSGAGLPGLVLAIARPDLQVTLVEPLLRRTTFLDGGGRRLGLDQRRGGARPGRGPARRAHVRRGHLPCGGPLDRLLGWSMPLVAPAGALVAMKGSSVAEEIEAAARRAERLGAAPRRGARARARLGRCLHHGAVRVAWADPSTGRLAASAARAADGAATPVEERRRRRSEGARRDRTGRVRSVRRRRTEFSTGLGRPR